MNLVFRESTIATA